MADVGGKYQCCWQLVDASVGILELKCNIISGSRGGSE